MSALILFRSLLYTQRGNQLLAQHGIPSTVVKAPRELEDRGCAYGLRLSERRLGEALRALREQSVTHGRVYVSEAGGKYREVSV